MIQVSALTKSYGPILALDRIDLEVDKGRILGFLGPNGAGKTTAIRILTCFMPATSGAASIDGCDVFTQSAEVRRRIGYLPEATPLYPEMRVEEELHYFGRLHGLSRPARRRRIDALSERCGLTDIRRRPIGQLSKGNRQRVGIAQAMLHDPPVLILDEPTAGLDPKQITEVRGLIRDLAGERTVLLSTHILPEVEKVCDEVAIIHRGRIAARGTPDELRRQVRRGAPVRVEVKAEPNTVAEALGGLDGVGDVTTEAHDGWTEARIQPRDAGQTLPRRIGEMAHQRGWVLRALEHEAASLEAFFVQITADEARSQQPLSAPEEPLVAAGAESEGSHGG